MKNKVSKFTFQMTVGIGLISSLAAYAGGERGSGSVGNGGIAVVCRNPSTGAVTSAELLDLFEAENLLDMKIGKGTGDVQNGINYAIMRLEESDPTMGKGEFDFLKSFTLTVQLNSELNMKFIPNGTRLILTDDALPTLTKAGCQFEQLANYESDGVVLVDEEIYSALSNTDKSALAIHEGLYKAIRDQGATDSRDARLMTGLLFAEPGNGPGIKSLIELMLLPYYTSESEAIVAISPEDRGIATFQFSFGANPRNSLECYYRVEWVDAMTQTSLYSFSYNQRYDGRPGTEPLTDGRRHTDIQSLRGTSLKAQVTCDLSNVGFRVPVDVSLILSSRGKTLAKIQWPRKRLNTFGRYEVTFTLDRPITFK